ncbi:hypothetical protein V5O48_010416, partial [Marasmius crinis-equi]
MSRKTLDPEKQPFNQPLSQPARSVSQPSRTKRILAFICLSTALYGLYGLTNLWSDVQVPRDVYRRPPPLGEKEKEKLFL